MDNKALYKLSYGVFLLSTKSGEKVNACITNTGIQVASNPTRIAISCLNTNYTCDLIKESGIFCLSLLDISTSFETIKHFGFQSGRNINKFSSLTLPLDLNGCPYLEWTSSSYLSGKVLEKMDLGTHTLFIAEVIDGKVLTNSEPLTYSYYLEKIKPKPEKKVEDKKIVGWRCKICGYEYKGESLPEDYLCPLCGHPKEDFEPIYEN